MYGLHSALKQNYRNLEILCVDDGSTDGSYKKIARIAKRDKRIRLIKTEHKGSGVARNVALDAATGKYVMFLDIDDEYPDKKTVGKLVSKAEETGFDIVGGSMIRSVDKNIERDWDDACKGFVFECEGPIEFKDYQFEYGFYRFIYRRDFLSREQIRFPYYLRYQDTLFMAQAMHKAGRFYALPDVVYLYHMHVRFGKWNEQQSIDCIKALTDMLRFATDNSYERLAHTTVMRINDFVPKMVEHFKSDEVRKACDEFLSEAKKVEPLDEYCYDVWERLGNEVLLQNDITKSKSYRIGRSITAIPRMMRSLFTK